ncbi:zinc ribbon domain-containing protein [Halocatena marina]|uniref:Zinc ribbon domain-containing protein n=1 Tax=Halocatena marina TaxID=2934937 RepID=A0ABD5YUC4_9EURY
MLKATFRNINSNLFKVEVKDTYTLLTGDDTTEGMRVQAKNTLQSDGVNTDQLLTDFVSHQSIYTYLTATRGVSKGSKSSSCVDSNTQTIQKLRGRSVAVIEQSLKSLRNTQRLRLGDFNGLVETQIYCRDCGTQFEVIQLLDRDECDCDIGTDSD